MGHTLVLNADYTPLSCIPISSIGWKDAIKQYWLGTVNAIEHYEDWQVHSPSTTLYVPSVVVSKRFMKKKVNVRFSRATLLLRDNFSCQYCYDELSMKDLTIDHVIPRARGGITRWDNVVAACYSCNAIKGHRTNMKPAVSPIKPEHYSLLNNARKLPITVPDKSWIPYLGWESHLITVQPPKKILETRDLSD